MGEDGSLQKGSQNKHSLNLCFVVSPAIIFLIALTLRLCFNFGVLEHRICDVGDSYFFLKTGNGLLQFVSSPGQWGHADVLIGQRTNDVLGSVLSHRLVDRLLLDGPAFPSYLAIAQFLVGIRSGCDNFAAYALPLSVVNSIVDSAFCVVVYLIGVLAFDQVSGIFAGLFFAAYIPAVVATAAANSEPFAYFALALWMLLVLKILLGKEDGRWQTLLISGFIGMTTGVVMLAKPAMVLFPLILGLEAVILFCLDQKPVKPLRLLGCSISFCLCLGMVFIPWITFSCWATGKPSIFVNRVPAYNFSMGNQLGSDGWVSYLPDVIPRDMGQAVAQVNKAVSSHPGEFLGLYLRKFARLWAGVWNDFDYTFIVNHDWQDIFHQLLLLLAVIGVALAFSLDSRILRSKHFKAACMLVGACLLHGFYLFFVPMPRYAVTAMPFVAVLAGFAVSKCLVNSRTCWSRFAILILMSALMFWLNKYFPSFAPFIAAPFMPFYLIEGISMTLWVVAFGIVAVLCFNLVLKVRPNMPGTAALVICVAFIAVASTFMGCSMSDPARREWKGVIDSKNNVARRSFCFSPGVIGNRDFQSYILVDVKGQRMAPGVAVWINGHLLDGPLVPWLEIGPNADKFLQSLEIESHVTGQSVQSFRQWWAIYCPRKWLKPDSENEIIVGAVAKPMVIFGQFVDQFDCQFRTLPSFRKFSWTKGFTCIDRGDPRIYECIELASRAGKCNQMSVKNVARSFGIQQGEYRIYLAVTPLAYQSGDNITGDQGQSCTVLRVPEEILISASDPSTFFVTKRAIRLPTTIPSCGRVVFRCQMRNSKPLGSGFVCLTLSGTDKSGKQINWMPRWQPSSIELTNEYAPIEFTEAIPPTIASLNNLSLTVMISPFHADLLFVKHSEALRRRVMVKNISVTVVPEPKLPSLALRKWMIY